MQALANEFALGVVNDWRSIEAGTINSNFGLDTEEGRFFLRVNEGKRVEEVCYEAGLLENLVAGGVVTPVPRRAVSGDPYTEYEGQFVSVFPWLDGEQVDSMSLQPGHCEALGAALAQLHEVGRAVPKHFHRQGRYTHDQIQTRFEDFKNSSDPELQPAIAALREEFEWLAEREADRAAGQRGIIHGDLYPDNVLVSGTEIVALLDFEQASVGSLIYDLSVAINAWCFGSKLEPERVTALIRGYESRLPLDAEKRALLNIELRGSALRFLVTRITDIYLSAGAPQTKDFRRFLMRLESWRATGLS